MAASLEIDPVVFKAFAYWATIVLAKTMFLSIYTSLKRFATGAFANPEDAKGIGKVNLHEESVERVRRCHLNDMENVFAFVMIGGLYTMVAHPALSTALWHFRVFGISRLLHTVVYLGQVPQPSRALLFGAGYLSCASMIYRILTA